MEVPALSYKDGLALTNGATFSAALLALAVHDGERLAATADGARRSASRRSAAAPAPSTPVHQARGLAGQIATAATSARRSAAAS